MVELRKRKDPPQPAPPAPARKRSSNPIKSGADKAKAAPTDEPKPSASSSKASSTGGFPTVGSSIDLDEFGGEIETNDGEKTSLKQLVDESTGGVVLFTYPKASTPGCRSSFCSPPCIIVAKKECRHQTSMSIPG